MMMKPIKEKSTKKKLSITLTFLGKQSLEIKKKLINIFHKFAPDMKLLMKFSSPYRLRNGFSFKERLLRDFDSMLLYKFSCNTYNSIYIGETKRHFIVWSLEHLGISLLTSNALKYNDTYANFDLSELSVISFYF